MADRGIEKRLRRIEERIARPEYAEYDKFFDGVFEVLGKSVDRRLAEDDMHMRVRARMDEIIWPGRKKKERRRDYRLPCRSGRTKDAMSNRQIRLGVDFARANRDELLRYAIGPLLSALRQALGELIDDEQLRKTVEGEAEAGFHEVVDRIRPEKKISY